MSENPGTVRQKIKKNVPTRNGDAVMLMISSVGKVLMET